MYTFIQRSLRMPRALARGCDGVRRYNPVLEQDRKSSRVSSPASCCSRGHTSGRHGCGDGRGTWDLAPADNGDRLTDTLSQKISKYESAVYFALLLFRSIWISLFGSVSAGLGTQQSLSGPNEPPFVSSIFRICRRTLANVALLECWWRVLNGHYSIWVGKDFYSPPGIVKLLLNLLWTAVINI